MESACRFSPTAQSLPPAVFQSLACAHCLFYIYFVTPPYSQNYQTQFCGANGLLICPQRLRTSEIFVNETDSGDNSVTCGCAESPDRIYNLPEYSLNGTSRSIEKLQLQPTLPNDFVLIVRQCCEAASRCCRNVLLADSLIAKKDIQQRRQKKPDKLDAGGQYNLAMLNETILTLWNEITITSTCPATWDGWHCFQRADPGELSAKCPNYIFGDRIRNDIDSLNAVKKNCLPNGEWYRVKRIVDAPSTEWTDYSGCVSNNAYTLKLFSGLIAFGITVISILPALFVFTLHRLLRNQPMFIIHRQLLYSFFFSGVFYIFNALFFAIDGAPGDHLYFMNHISCRLLFTVQLRFFRTSTFSWMLAEGVYLYRLLMCTFTSHTESLRPYFISCWGAPLLITAIYSILRQAFDNEECWITPTKVWFIEWTIIGPCLVALSINLFLMMVIFCVLLKKLRCNPDVEESAQYTKAVRAVFMLVPVFGLHFLITIYRIQSYLHQIINLILDGLQGFIVVLIVCYTNRAVLECMKTWALQRWEERKLRRQSQKHRMRFKRSIQERNCNSSCVEQQGLSQLSRINSTTSSASKNNNSSSNNDGVAARTTLP